MREQERKERIMTKEQLETANKLSQEIEKMAITVGNLELTIEMQEDDSFITGKSPVVLKPFLRLFNGKEKADSKQEAKVILFKGLESHPWGIELPVDIELIKILHTYFSGRLKEMEAEFAALGNGMEQR